MEKEYIEREKAVEAAFSATSLGNSTFRDVHDVVDRLRVIPAADVVEVRHAHLVNPNPYGKCSACGMLIDIRDGFKFCPNCGAKMTEDYREQKE